MVTDPNAPDPESRRYVAGVGDFDIGGSVDPYLGFSFSVSSSGSAKFEGHHSTDLFSWDPDPNRFVLTNRLRNPDGTHRMFYRLAQPVGADGADREFIRLNVSE